MRQRRKLTQANTVARLTAVGLAVVAKDGANGQKGKDGVMAEWFLVDYDGWQHVGLRDPEYGLEDTRAYECLDYLVKVSNRERSPRPYNPSRVSVTSIGFYDDDEIVVSQHRPLANLPEAVWEEGGSALAAIVGNILDTKWKWLTNDCVSVDDDGYIITCRDPRHYFTPQRWVRASLAKTLSWMDSKVLLQRRFTACEIERANHALCVNKHLPLLSHRIVTGQEVYDTYQEWPWSEKLISCMTGCSSVCFYSDNPNNVAMIKIYKGDINKHYDKDSKLKPQWIGRALLWTADNGRRVVDRVYPTDGGIQFTYVKHLALSQGWMMRDVVGIAPKSIKITGLKVRMGEMMPHLDTMRIAGYVEDRVNLFVPKEERC